MVRASPAVACETPAVLDERWIRSLHVEAMRRGDLHGGHEPHVLFQASTVGALIDGAFEGDVTLGELAEQGDIGLGTLNHLDGEMILVDGVFYRADIEGRTHEVGPGEKTPFAVVTNLQATLTLQLEQRLTQEELLARLDAEFADRAPRDAPSWAVRVDGRFESVKVRSVPRQEPPYRKLTEVVADQHVFEISPVAGTIVGFRFPDYVEGIEVAGYHLHFISDDRSRGGHVLDFAADSVAAQLDPSSELHVELPPQGELGSAQLPRGTHAAIDAGEHQG